MTQIASFESSSEVGIIRELQQNNKLLKQQDSVLTLLLQKQFQADSFLSKEKSNNAASQLPPGSIKTKSTRLKKGRISRPAI